MEPALGRFTSIDPLAEKYYSWSPYAYVANNPINAIDPNGDSIWYTVDKDIITMHVTGKVINASSDNINLGRAAKDIASAITEAFAGKLKINGAEYTLNIKADISSAKSMDDVTSSDHLFVMSDRIEPADIPGRGSTNEQGGKVMSVWSGDYANDNWLSNRLSYNNTRTAVHEFGHAFGLSHETASGYANLMEQGIRGTKVTSIQRGYIINNYIQGGLNRGSNSMLIRGVIQPNPSYIYYDSKQKQYISTHINRIGLNHKY